MTSLQSSTTMRDERTFGSILGNTDPMMTQIHSPSYVLLKKCFTLIHVLDFF